MKIWNLIPNFQGIVSWANYTEGRARPAPGWTCPVNQIHEVSLHPAFGHVAMVLKSLEPFGMLQEFIHKRFDAQVAFHSSSVRLRLTREQAMTVKRTRSSSSNRTSSSPVVGSQIPTLPPNWCMVANMGNRQQGRASSNVTSVIQSALVSEDA